MAFTPQPQIWTVSEVTTRILQTLNADTLLQSIMVQGEISNFKKYSSGHSYFTLKDGQSRLRCVLFRGNSINIPFVPKDGQEVMAMGRIGVYPAAGEYQLYVEHMIPGGEGALHYAFAQLKEKLAQEGLFDQKRPIPLMPSRVGIITSHHGAVLRDIMTVSKRRNPHIDLILAPAMVQGRDAPASIISAIQLCNRFQDLDVIILGRGGGSLEELWCFNDEGVARAIYASQIPIVSAVGHETDVTIADFVADLRAPTPSAAAELVVPDYYQWQSQLINLQQRISRALVNKVYQSRKSTSQLMERGCLARPLERIDQHRQNIDQSWGRLLFAFNNTQKMRRQSWASLTGKLEALSPLGILARGYSICRHPQNKEIYRQIDQIHLGDPAEVLLIDGVLSVEITSVKKAK